MNIFKNEVTNYVFGVLNANASYVISYHAPLLFKYQFRSSCVVAISPGNRRARTSNFQGEISQPTLGPRHFSTLTSFSSPRRPSPTTGSEKFYLKKGKKPRCPKAKCRPRLNQRNQAKGNVNATQSYCYFFRVFKFTLMLILVCNVTNTFRSIFFYYLAWLTCRKSVFVGGSVHVGHENDEKQLESK